MSRFSAEEKRREAEREVEMRKSVYPSRIMRGNMSQRDADRKIAIIQEIADEYAKVAEKDRLL